MWAVRALGSFYLVSITIEHPTPEAMQPRASLKKRAITCWGASRRSLTSNYLRRRNALYLIRTRAPPHHAPGRLQHAAARWSRLPQPRTCSRLDVPDGAGRGFRSGFSKHRSGSHDLTPGKATEREPRLSAAEFCFSPVGSSGLLAVEATRARFPRSEGRNVPVSTCASVGTTVDLDGPQGLGG
jgi:hypothetical protein